MVLMCDLMIPLDDIGEINKGQVPYIDWAESKVGWSFLDDIQNRFSVDGTWWLFQRILREPTLKRRFVQSMEPLQWRQWAMKQYKQHLVHL